MKALILYRSYHGNTKEVAETIAGEIKRLGHNAEAQDLRRKLPDLGGIDAIVIGAPTRMARVTRKAKSVLKKLKKVFGGKPVAVFDTYGPVPTKPDELEKTKKWLYPGAAGIMQSVAKDLGLNVYENTLRCEVAGSKGPLKDKEKDKAAAFAKAFMAAIKKKS
jgi:flavodoxin